MRIAFFGGSFDPPHRGHLAIARAAIQRLALDIVWMAPAGVQPFKLEGASTSYEDRLAMVELAVAGDFHVIASDVDAPRTDGMPNYTFDIIASIRATLERSDTLFFLLGADAFLTLKQWHRAAELLFLSDFIVAAAQEAAHRAIEETQIIRLSIEDQRRFAEALINPPEPNDALRRAAQLHAEHVEVR